MDHWQTRLKQVDGSFLGELRESDLMDSIGMQHKLHLKKLFLARQKLTPLSAAELSMASTVRREESATATREGIPDIDTAFSQARLPRHEKVTSTELLLLVIFWPHAAFPFF